MALTLILIPPLDLLLAYWDMAQSDTRASSGWDDNRAGSVTSFTDLCMLCEWAWQSAGYLHSWYSQSRSPLARA